MPIELPICPLTASAFAPFGEVIEADPSTMRLINGGTTERFHALAAPQAVGGPGSVLLWLSDATDGQHALAQARSERDEAMAAFEALSGLIEAAPFPMWFRGTDLNLALVNSA